MNEKIIVSQGVANSVQWLKNNNISFDTFFKMIKGGFDLNNLTEEVIELGKLDNVLIYNILNNGYEVKKYNTKELPNNFKFKNNINTEIIFKAVKFEEMLIISWINEFDEHKSTSYSIKDSISAINLGYWIIVD